MSLAAMVKAMAVSGCSTDQVAAAVAAYEEERLSKKRAGNADRQRRYRERNASNAFSGVMERDTPSPKEIPPTPPKEIPPTPETPLEADKSASPPAGGGKIIDFPKDEKPKRRTTDLDQRDLDIFETAWSQYPRDGKSSKAKALERFARLGDWEREDFVWGVQLYVNHLAEERKRWPDKRPCDCVVFINQRRWEPLMEAAGIVPLAEDQRA